MSYRSVAVFSHIPKLTDCLKNVLPEVHFFEVPQVSENTLSMLQESEIIVSDYRRIAPILYQLPKVKWIQASSAGADLIFKVYDRTKPRLPFTITRFSGNFCGTQMSEYVVSQIVNRERSLFQYNDWQRSRTWQKVESIRFRRSIPELTIGILGAGAIGKEIAKVLKVLGATIWGVGKTPLSEKESLPNIDEYRLLSQLPEVLHNCDYVINLLPGTEETTGILSGGVLRHCANKKSTFINIGRGNVVPEDDLIKALKEGWLRGAILDVFNTEPLPTDCELWGMEQVTISPHIAGVIRAQDVAMRFKENYERFKAGEPLLHILDLEKGY